jgi:hypothetical protein
MTSRLAAALLAVLALLPICAFAATTGSIAGTVTDGTGAALPGVTVTAEGPQLQGRRTTVSDARGAYTLSLLPPGTYRVELALGGFDTVAKSNVRVALDTTTPLDATMAIGATSEAITVTAEAVVVDPTQTAVQQNFGPRHLAYATIGTAGRSYQSVVQQAPGVAGGANPQVMGANLGQNNYMLDGVNTTDPVTHTFGSNLPFDAIQEVSVQMLGKDAEYGRAIGGVVNVVTKSGGNTFSGSLDARFTNDSLSETNDFYSDDRVYQETQPSATLGGPIVRDRLWFFGTLERVDDKRDNPPATYGDGAFTIVPGTRTFDGWNSLVKLTATPLANHTISFRYTDNRATIEHAQESALFTPEADSKQEQRSTIYNLGYEAVLNANWLASVQIGVRRGTLETLPMNGDITIPAQYNDTYGTYDDSYPNVQSGDRDRNELIASTTYFLEAAGSHQLKAGLNLDQSTFSSSNNYTGQGFFDEICTAEFGFTGPCGGFLHVHERRAQGGLLNHPFYAEVHQINPEETFDSDLSAVYVQDEWRPLSGLTTRLGLRYETEDFQTSDGVAHQPSFSKLQPRLGVAWDVFNDARSIAHGFWGRVMDDNGLTLASFGSAAPSYVRLFLYNPETQLYDIDTGIFQGGSTGNSYASDLKPTISNEFTIGFTQRVWTNTSVDITGVWRKSEDLFEDSCAGAACPNFVMTNHPNGLDVLESRYEGIIARVEARPYTWLNGLVSYTWSKSRGSVEYTQNAGADFDVFPAHFVNRSGYLSDDARHRVKASGFVRAPWGTTFGIDGYWQSGSPDNITMALGNDTPNAGSPTAFYGTVFVLPRGQRRLADLYNVDFQALHEIALGKVTVGLIGTIYNLLGTDIVTNRGSSIGTYAACHGGTVRPAAEAHAGDCVANPLFGIVTGAPQNVAVSDTSLNEALDSQLPRRYELGIRLSF